jgi:high-affinity K+ transport system ATPase subunit B
MTRAIQAVEVMEVTRPPDAIANTVVFPVGVVVRRAVLIPFALRGYVLMTRAIRQ